MKKIFLLVTALTMTIIINAQDDKEQPYMTKPLSGDNIKEARVQTSGGSISVSGVEGSQARIEVYVRSSNSRYSYSKEELKQKLEEDYDLEINAAGGTLTAIAKTKKMN